MNKIETIIELGDAICNLPDAVYHLNRTLESDHVYQARIEQYTQSIGTMIDELGDTHNEIDEEVCAEVRNAIIDDRQYAFESVMYWQSGGHDLADIAGRLETDVVVLVDLIDEFGED